MKKINGKQLRKAAEALELERATMESVAEMLAVREKVGPILNIIPACRT
jgi:hypothetical protein